MAAAPLAWIAGDLRPAAAFVAAAREDFTPDARATVGLAGAFAPCALIAGALATVPATPRLPPAFDVVGLTTADAPGRAEVPALRLGVVAACLLGDVARFIGLLTLSGRRTDPA